MESAARVSQAVPYGRWPTDTLRIQKYVVDGSFNLDSINKTFAVEHTGSYFHIPLKVLVTFAVDSIDRLAVIAIRNQSVGQL